MSWRQTAWIILVAAALGGCATTEYRNDRRPEAGRPELTRDMDECRATSMVSSAPMRVGGEYDRAILVVDDTMLSNCLAARGWRPVPR